MKPYLAKTQSGAQDDKTVIKKIKNQKSTTFLDLHLGS